MKLFQASCDTTLITLVAEDRQDAIKLVMEYHDNDPFLYVENNKLYWKFNDNYTEEMVISTVKSKRGVIQYESH